MCVWGGGEGVSVGRGECGMGGGMICVRIAFVRQLSQTLYKPLEIRPSMCFWQKFRTGLKYKHQL